MTPGPPVTRWIEIVEEDAGTDEPLDQLATAAATVAELDQTKEDLLTVFVDRARAAGKSWSEISAALGVTKQAAHRRFSMSDTSETSRYTPRARTALERAPEVARALRHPAVGTEHLVLAILEDPDSLASVVLAAHEVDAAGVRTAALAVTPPEAEPSDGVLPLTPRAVAAVKGALTVALELGHNYIGTEHLLLAAVRDPEAVAARILAASGLSSDELHAEVVRRINEIYAARKAAG